MKKVLSPQHKQNISNGMKKAWELEERLVQTSCELSHLAVLTREKVKEIRRLYATGDFSHRFLGNLFGVAHTNIGSIVRNETWTRIEETESLLKGDN